MTRRQFKSINVLRIIFHFLFLKLDKYSFIVFHLQIQSSKFKHNKNKNLLFCHWRVEIVHWAGGHVEHLWKFLLLFSFFLLTSLAVNEFIVLQKLLLLLQSSRPVALLSLTTNELLWFLFKLRHSDWFSTWFFFFREIFLKSLLLLKDDLNLT